MTFHFSKQIEVRFRDCDSMGHVNNAVYLTYLEVGRFAYWRHVVGPPSEHMPGFILARMEIDYRGQAEAGDVLDVLVRLDAIGRTSFTIVSHIVRPADGALIAQSKAVLVVYDYEQRAPVPVPEQVRMMVSAFERRPF